MSISSPTSQPNADDILRVTRILAAVIVPILFVAWVMLYLFPHLSGELFAWPIRPQMTAMMLGAAYLGGAYFFARVVLAQQWHTVSLGIIPVSAFAGYLGIATITHWDRFTPGHISFVLWAFLYLTLPFVLVIVWFWNRSHAGATRAIRHPDLPQPLRLVFGAIGLVLTVVSVILLVSPDAMIPSWPWTLSPLTGRVMAALFVLPGLVGLGIAWDGRWSAARYIVQAQVLALVLIIVAAVLSNADFDWSQIASWTLMGSFVLLTLLLSGVYIVFERRDAT